MDFTETLAKPDPNSVNIGLKSPTVNFITSLLGNPRNDYTGDCQPVTNVKLKSKMVTQSVGPFKVTGHIAAVESLRETFAQVNLEVPELHALLGTAGMLCARKVKRKDGTLGKNPSNHSWGMAIDIKINGKLDKHGDDKTQRGLLMLARYMNAAGWYWGVSFPTEDSMHFEASTALLQKWRDAGKL
jgi:D-alanyl-D-alanine carboxypeptidase